MSDSGAYRHAIEECDVLDKKQLKNFRSLRLEWIAWLHGDDPHSIWRQINSMLWDDVLFRTINDLRRRSIEHPIEGVGFNGAVLRMFDAGFVTTQVTAIRRLTDRQPRDKRKGVISLRRLIAEIRANRTTITREVYVSYDGLPYDPEPARDAWFRRRAATLNTPKGEWLDVHGPEAWDTSEMVHESFDKLSRHDKGKARSRKDTIAEDWLDWLDTKLDQCNDLRKYVDKFIAHSAEPASRHGLTESQTAVTLHRLRSCQRVLYQVAAFLYGPVLCEGSYGAVPVPQFDHLANFEKAWVASDDVSSAHELWDRHIAEIESWVSESPWPEDGGA